MYEVRGRLMEKRPVLEEDPAQRRKKSPGSSEPKTRLWRWAGYVQCGAAGEAPLVLLAVLVALVMLAVAVLL